jgi:hypothetical protein
MQTEGDDTAHRAPTLEGALGEALAGLPEAVDYRWLAVGMLPGRATR